ncbi:hypothetical protein C8R46DRAFT_1034062 [Mycena filopes]|nr:hypothetical protein C8R46DRAFT_1034062 [Mycena filopes]
MSWATPFLGAATPLDSDGFPDMRGEGKDGEGYQGDEHTPGWIRIRPLTHRESEMIGMWSASLKVMAGTQHLLPTIPNALPLSHSPYHPYPRLHASHDSRPSAPPASPQRLRERRTESTRGILHDASAACSKIMHLAQTLERRTNAERRLTRKKRRRPPRASVVRPAAASTVTAVGDSIPCRAATVRPPRPASPASLRLVGLLSDVPPSVSCPPLSSHSAALLADNPISVDDAPPPAPTYTDASVDPLPSPLLVDASIQVDSARSFADAAVTTVPSLDHHNTTYGIVSDPFARSLAGILPLDLEHENRLARAIYLDDWRRWAQWFRSEHLPPTQRVYLNALAAIFRPWRDPQLGHSMALGLNPVYNLFTHWWSGWNAIPYPTRPPERDLRYRYDYLSDPELHGEMPLSGRGFVVQHASGF